MANRTKLTALKQVVVRADIHARLRRVCFENEVEMKDLVNLMLSSVLEDSERLQEIIGGIRSETT